MSELVHRPRQYHRFTEDRQRLCLQALEMGYTRTAACAAAGITKPTFYNWLNDLSDLTLWGDESEALTFAQRVQQAEARAQGKAETIVLSKIPKDPALAWRFLAQRFPEDWQNPEATQRIAESKTRIAELKQKIELARMELELARLERELLDAELGKVRSEQSEQEDINDGGTDADQEHAAGAGAGAERGSQEIEIEYFDVHPPQDSDSEAP